MFDIRGYAWAKLVVVMVYIRDLATENGRAKKKGHGWWAGFDSRLLHRSTTEQAAAMSLLGFCRPGRKSKHLDSHLPNFWSSSGFLGF